MASGFSLPSNFHVGGIGSANSGGGLSVPGVSSSRPANPINFGYTAPAPPSGGGGGGQVQGASPSANRSGGGGGSSGGGPRPAAQAPSAPSAPSSGGGNNLPSLDSIYAPIFSWYDQMTGQVQGAQNQDVGDLTNTYNANKALIPGYEKSATGTIDANQQNLNQQLQSAYDQAARNYQWANAGALNQYGYNGAYQGANTMAQQEMERELGQIGQQGVQGQEQIGTQRTDLQNWVNQQNTTLDQQFSDAKDQLNQFFQQQLFAINSDRSQSEAQKAAGKVQLLQDVMNQNNQIQLQYQGFQQQLALLNTTGGTNYNISPFLSSMGTLGNQINSTSNPANQSYGVLTGQPQGNFTAWAPTQANNNDILNQILGGQLAGTNPSPATAQTSTGFTGTGF